MKRFFSTRFAVAVALLFITTGYVAAQDASKLPAGVVARQGDAEVTLQDIDAYAAKIPENDRAAFFDSPKRIESVIMTLLLQKQLAAAARKDKLDADPAVLAQIAQSVDDALARVEQQHYRSSIKLPDFDKLAREY